MKRRPITLLAATMVVAALVVATGTAPARAGGIVTADYRLTSTSDIPVPDANATAPQVVAAIVPPGAVVPPTEADGTAGSPLTILNSSSGFDQSQLIVALKNGTDSSGQTEQLFGLSFFGNGFSKNGQLDFALNLGNSVTTPPVLQSMTPGVSIVALPSSSDSSGSTAPVTGTRGAGGNSVPEPMSVVLWSTVAGLGLIRARARTLRRRRAA